MSIIVSNKHDLWTKSLSLMIDNFNVANEGRGQYSDGRSCQESYLQAGEVAYIVLLMISHNCYN